MRNNEKNTPAGMTEIQTSLFDDAPGTSLESGRTQPACTQKELRGVPDPLTEMEEQILYWARLVRSGSVHLSHSIVPDGAGTLEKASAAIHAMRSVCAENRAQVERHLGRLQKRRRSLRRRLARMPKDVIQTDYRERARLQSLHRGVMREICALRTALDMAAHGRMCGAVYGNDIDESEV